LRYFAETKSALWKKKKNVEKRRGKKEKGSANGIHFPAIDPAPAHNTPFVIIDKRCAASLVEHSEAEY